MKRSVPVVGVILLASFGVSFAHLHAKQQSADKPKSSEQAKAGSEDVARENPVKSSPEGLAEARKVFGYDCAMCHGEKGDGKGDIVESMKLEMHDWRDPAVLARKTDAELFNIITKGKGKMMGEGDRVPEKLRWNLVNLVHAMAAKSGGEQKAAATTSSP